MINQIFSQIYYLETITYPLPFLTFESILFFRRNPVWWDMFSRSLEGIFFPLFQVDQNGSQDCFPPMSGVAAAIDRYGLAEFPKLSAEELFKFSTGNMSSIYPPKV